MQRILEFTNPVSAEVFDRLTGAVKVIGRDGLGGNASYQTTFWYPREQQPANVAEEAIVELARVLPPIPECIGMEWWLGRLGHGRTLRLHYDRDLSLQKKTGQIVHPVWSSILYLNAFPSSPTVILEPVSEPGCATQSEIHDAERRVEAVPNRYVAFRGDLRHGVIPRVNPSLNSVRRSGHSHLRLTLLVNYWHRRPLQPACVDFDGSVYAPLRDRIKRAS